MIPVLLLASFLLGSIPFAALIAKGIGRVDVRSGGSGNPGASNVYRLAGPVAGVLVFLLDIAKGLCPVLAAQYWQPGIEFLPHLAGFASALGHIFSPFLKFKGGKGVATFMGTFIGLYWQGVLIAILPALVVVALTRIFSLGSLLGALLIPLSFMLLEDASLKLPGLYTLVYSWLAFLLILVRHKENIIRLWRKQEFKINAE